MDKQARPSTPPERCANSDWATVKVWDAVRRAALMGAAELRRVAAVRCQPRR